MLFAAFMVLLNAFVNVLFISFVYEFVLQLCFLLLHCLLVSHCGHWPGSATGQVVIHIGAFVNAALRSCA